MLKKFFIPDKTNDFQPYSLRKKAVLATLILVLLLEGFFLIQIFFVFRYTNLFSSILPNVLIDLANSDRQKNNLGGLAPNSLLEQAALLKAQDMAAKGYFAHTSPDGAKPWAWLDKVGYSYLTAGENLAINFSDSGDIENAWMASPGHRANILNNNFTEIGIATAKGTYKGQEATFVVQFFGRPEVAAAAGAITKTPEPKKTLPKSVAQAPTAPLAEPPAEEMTVVRQVQNETDVSGVAVANPPIAENQIESQSSVFQKLLVTPRAVSNAIYLFLAGFVILALVLKVFIKIKIQYPKLIFNGVLILFVVISIFYLNSLLIRGGGIF